MPDYDSITAAQWVVFLWVAVIVFSIMWWLFWRGVRTEQVERDDAGPVEIVERAWLALLHWRPSARPSVMSTSSEQAPALIAPANRSIDQSAPTGLGVQTSAESASGLEPSADGAAPDMDAEQTGSEEWKMPRVSRYLNDDDFLIMLASQKLPAGKWRLSANKIVEIVGGDRTKVLALIRQVREAPAVFPALTPEQAQAREQLQLNER